MSSIDFVVPVYNEEDGLLEATLETLEGGFRYVDGRLTLRAWVDGEEALAVLFRILPQGAVDFAVLVRWAGLGPLACG